jgi:hypothetical protein
VFPTLIRTLQGGKRYPQLVDAATIRKSPAPAVVPSALDRAQNAVSFPDRHHATTLHEQAYARIVRLSQTSKTVVVHLSGTAVEQTVYIRLKDKRTLQMFRSRNRIFERPPYLGFL